MYYLKIFALVSMAILKTLMLGVYTVFVVVVALSIVFFIFGDLFSRFFPQHRFLKPFDKKPLTPANYVGIAILVAFIIWPSAKEVSLGGLTVKKLDSRITTIEEKVDDLFARKRTEKLFQEDFIKLTVTEFKNASSTVDWYEYHIPLKDKPVKNSVSLWLGGDAVNPLYYTIKEQSVVLRHKDPMNMLGKALQYVKPA